MFLYINNVDIYDNGTKYHYHYSINNDVSIYKYVDEFDINKTIYSTQKLVFVLVGWWNPITWMCFDDGFGFTRSKRIPLLETDPEYTRVLEIFAKKNALEKEFSEKEFSEKPLSKIIFGMGGMAYSN